MKRIGIMTFHNVPNYGAILQAFALSNAIKKLDKHNIEVEIVDYKCEGNGAEFSPKERFRKLSRSRNFVYRLIKRIAIEFKVAPAYKRKIEAFSEFSQMYLKISKSPEDNKLKYDVVLLGSDQIWNPRITGGFQKTYFGQNNNIYSRIWAGYAASCGDINEFSAEEKNELLQCLSTVDRIGVREIGFLDFLNHHNVESIHNLDPTFLLNLEEYDELLHLNGISKDGYILEYALQKNLFLDEITDMIAKKKGLKIIRLCGYQDLFENTRNRIFDSGPLEMLKLLAHADYIVTNSFHGVALSIIFKKNFNVVLPATRKGRVSDLLLELSLSNRIVNNKDYEDCDINYNEIDNNLERMIIESKTYLRNIILEN